MQLLQGHRFAAALAIAAGRKPLKPGARIADQKVSHAVDAESWMTADPRSVSDVRWVGIRCNPWSRVFP
jgi:hypothetical protein